MDSPYRIKKFQLEIWETNCQGQLVIPVPCQRWQDSLFLQINLSEFRKMTAVFRFTHIN